MFHPYYNENIQTYVATSDLHRPEGSHYNMGENLSQTRLSMWSTAKQSVHIQWTMALEAYIRIYV